MDDSNTMTEDVKDAWDESKAEDYPVHDLDDSVAEEDPANSVGFIGGNADQRPVVEDKPTEETSDEPEADASDTASPSAKADDDASKVDAGLISRAQEVGLSTDDISDFSEAQVERMVAFAQRTQDRAALQPPPAKEEPRTEPEEEFKIELDPEYQDPEVIKAFKSMDQRHRAHNKQLQDQLDELVGHAKDQARRAKQNEFDSWVNGLPEEYSEILGKGPTSEMDENGAFFRMRNQVAINAAALGAQNGSASGNRAEMLKRGLHATLGDKVIQIERAIEKKGESKRRRRTTAVPTHKREREPQEPLGDRAAKQWVREFIHAEGLDSPESEGLLSGQEEGI